MSHMSEGQAESEEQKICLVTPSLSASSFSLLLSPFSIRPVGALAFVLPENAV